MGDITTSGLMEIERRVLQLLCQENDGERRRNRARELLSSYSWSEGGHQAVFDILMSFPSTSVQALREQLPARLTRRGFPDFDFEALFTECATSSDEAEKWMRILAESR